MSAIGNLPNASLIDSLNNSRDPTDGILPHLPGHPEQAYQAWPDENWPLKARLVYPVFVPCSREVSDRLPRCACRHARPRFTGARRAAVLGPAFMPGAAFMAQTSVEPFGNHPAGALSRPKQPAACGNRNWPACHAKHAMQNAARCGLGRLPLCWCHLCSAIVCVFAHPGRQPCLRHAEKRPTMGTKAVALTDSKMPSKT